MDSRTNVTSIIVRTADVVNSELWRLFPAINVDKTKDIPCDYPGAMGVPITFLDKYDRERFEILGIIKPKIGSKELYRRIIIRNLHPDLPKYINLSKLLEKSGSEYEITGITVEKRSASGSWSGGSVPPGGR